MSDRDTLADTAPCDDCEFTPSGMLAHSCAKHSCATCGHLAHPDDGCAHPDPRTGWCECEDYMEGDDDE